MPNGVLPVFKPKGWTSHDIVAKLRKILGQKRIGHTGTLDPEAEGVLVLCLGQATKIVQYIQDHPKTYIGTLTLGTATDTEDHTGSIIEKSLSNIVVDEKKLKEAMKGFLGEIEQIPPMFSALKVKGKKLYDLAREGKVIERKARKVKIYNFSFTKIEHLKNPIIHFKVTCSSGTYVRTLCVDLGKKLGYPAHMSSLLRIENKPFYISDCYTLEEIETLDIGDLIIDIGSTLGYLPAVVLSDENLKDVCNGLHIVAEDFSYLGPIRIFTESGKFCAIYRKDGEFLKPEKVFSDIIFG